MDFKMMRVLLDRDPKIKLYDNSIRKVNGSFKHHDVILSNYYESYESNDGYKREDIAKHKEKREILVRVKNRFNVW